jgi:hypothetical protein
MATAEVLILECSICLEQFDCLEQFNDHPCCTSGNNLCSTDLMSPFWLQKSTWMVKILLSCKFVWRKHETLKSLKNVTDCNVILKKKLYTRSYIYCIKILKSAVFIYMYKTIYLLQKTNQWTSFKPVSENQTQTGFFAIKTPLVLHLRQFFIVKIFVKRAADKKLRFTIVLCFFFLLLFFLSLCWIVEIFLKIILNSITFFTFEIS